VTVFQAIVLGAVQGATEFIPVSSTGHLIVVPWLLGWNANSLAFDLATHVGTLAGVLWYFWRDWVHILSSLARLALNRGRCDDPTRQAGLIGLFIVAGCVPAALAGVAFGDVIEERLRHPLFVAATTGGVALVMLAADRLGRKERGWASAGLRDWVLIGVAQALALMPGVSRSGITISAGLALGLQRDAAARCSFLLSAPIIAGAAGLQLGKDFRSGLPMEELQMFIVAAISAGVVGYLCIRFLLDYLRQRGLAVFVYYRLALAALIVALYFWRGQGMS
jgi:undecaprenyl-diphosphatase